MDTSQCEFCDKMRDNIHLLGLNCVLFATVLAKSHYDGHSDSSEVSPTLSKVLSTIYDAAHLKENIGKIKQKLLIKEIACI